METSVKITMIIVAGIIILGLIGYAIFNNMAPAQTVSANGQAQIKVVPDLVTVYFNIETKGNTASEAASKNANISDDLITALIKQGFERKDIQTQNYNVYPEYRWDGSRQIQEGYKATNSLKIEFSTDKTDKIGSVIDAGINAGATISYINFELSMEKQNEYKAQALKQATEDARTKADAIASGLGRKLGEVYSVSTSNFDYYPWRMYDAVSTGNLEVAKQAVTNIQPSEQEVNAQVSVSYKIK